MYIAMLTNTFWPVQCGMEMVFHNLAMQFSKDGHNIFLFAPHYKMKYDEITTKYNIIRYDPNKSILSTYKDISKIIKFDVLFVQSAFSAATDALRIKERFNLPVVLRLHGEDIQTDIATGYGWRLDPEKNNIITHNILNVDACIAISNLVQKELCDISSAINVQVINNGIDIELFYPNKNSFLNKKFGLSSKYKKVLMVGRNVSKKQFHLGLEAFAEALKKYPSMVLIHAGKEGNGTDLAQTSQKLGICDNFFQLGPVDYREINKIYNSCDIFLFPSKIETFGNVTLEAMACGLPCIEFDYGANHDKILNGINGYIVPYGNTKLMALHILELMNNEKHYKTFSKNARDHVVNKFSWKIVAEQYISVFKNVISKYDSENIKSSKSQNSKSVSLQTNEYNHNKPLSIAIVAYGPNHINGPNIWLQRMLPVLAQKGFEPHVIFLMFSNTACQVFQNLTKKGIKCTQLPFKQYTEENIIQLLKILKQNSPDIFIPNLSVPAYFASKWLQDAGIPSVGIIRSDDNFYHELIDTFVDSNSTFCLSGFVSKSQYLGKTVYKRKTESLNTLVCPSGTLLPEQTALPPESELRLVYTGRLIQRQKRIFDLIKAFHTAVTHIEGVSATLYGEDREGGKVVKIIEELALGNKLKYGGLLSYDKIYDELLRHHVFVLLSDYEGMSTSLMEAMSCGLVPICTRTKSGATEIIRNNENGLLVDNRNEDFLDAVRRLKTEQGLWERLSKNARKTIQEKYSTDICADRWAEFLRGLHRESSSKKNEIQIPHPNEINLPPVKQSEDGMCREDKRLPAHLKVPSAKQDPTMTTSTDIFINPSLCPDFADLYIVRKAIKDSFTQTIPLFSGTLLDVGCGQMPYKEYIVKANPNIKKYIGLDFAQGKYADLKQSNIAWDGKTIPLDDASVDCAMAMEVLERCFEPLTVLKEIKRVLKPDGFFFFTVPFLWPLHDTRHDYYRYTPFSLERLLSDAGFEEIQVKPMGGWNASLAQMIGLWLKRAPMPDETRKQVTEQLFPLYKQLIDSDGHSPQQVHSDNTLTPGWSGFAYKPLGQKSKIEMQMPAVKKTPKLCIVRHEHFAYSQTFIEDHIAYLSKNTEIVHGEHLPMFNQNKKCILEPEFIKSIQNIKKSLSDEIYAEAFSFYLKQNTFDVVLAEFGVVGAKVYKACKRAGIPYVVHFHGYDATERPTLQKFEREYRDIFQSAAGLVVVSKAMREKLISLGAPPDKIVLNPYGVDVSREDLASPLESPPVFLAVGRFVEKKAPHLTIQAFAKTAKIIPESRLIMVGDGPLLELCQSLVQKLGIQEQVIFAGVHSRRAVAKLMRLSRAFVQHSVTAENGDTEGLPLAILEAGAAGLPVVSTRHAGIPDAVLEGENGFLVDEGDIEKMSEAILSLAKNPKLAGWMGQKYHSRVVEHFSREKSIEGLRCILKKAAKGTQNNFSDSHNMTDGVKRCNLLKHKHSFESLHCPICKHSSPSFAEFGNPPRKNAMCPQCGSLERHRFLWYYLQNHSKLLQRQNISMLHFAPEPCLEKYLRILLKQRYTTADLHDDRADKKIDITDIHFPDKSFDIVNCCHVLEHIPDDTQALKEMYRVLKPGGTAIIMVPLKGENTFEDLSITDPKIREKLYGQHDHVRYYGMDIVQRIEHADFQVAAIKDEEIMSNQDLVFMAIKKNEVIFVCNKTNKI